MVIGAFPVAKLGTLLLRQVSKPIANFAKERAKRNPFFRTYICMPPAQFYNWCEVKMKMWVMNLGKPVEIPKLNEAMAIELGANLLGEAIIFTVAAGVLLLEYVRQVRKEAAKEDTRLREMNTLTVTIQDLYFQAERQDTQIRELTRTIYDLEKKVRGSRGPFGGFNRGTGQSAPEPSNNKEQTKSTSDSDLRENAGVVTHAVHYITKTILT